MQYRHLGNTGFKVSRLCFGALTIGPLQANLPVAQGARVLRRALEYGVNFIDTAEYYQTYPYIKEALKGWTSGVYITTKSYAYTREGMQKSLHRALQELNRDYIDIFLLHEQESILTIKGHWEAMEYLLQAKQAGKVRAVGISTHCVAGVTAAASIPEIDVIHPLINIDGIGIQDGTAADMLEAIKSAARAGKGLYGMKALGGGNLLASYDRAIQYVLGIDELSAVAVGMQTIEEVEYNVRVFNGEEIPAALQSRVRRKPRQLHIEEWCRGCGACVERCQAGALKVVNNKAVVDKKLCRVCGYCGAVCPEFCIKII
ncbi:aryl-alcohol dehydrogenase-like predicted oxidoreductase [Desulfohalotomaculum tongense]|uniref:aldo/keto reductase n=1 Tax=Desulforadius tongensis TaxID=1216062 RepID=UPI00195B80C8|nr:aldo/keto reductase [Desulforadius tongensis]MBM7855025.1 aryl-alcohol dehydrogenase-like predicted oxidoreductase [Desulforadius tongensis]